jgi:adenylate cyclase
LILLYKYAVTIPNGVLLPDARALQDTAELLESAERSGATYTLACAQYVRGLALVYRDGPERAAGPALLAAAQQAGFQQRFTRLAGATVETMLANEKARVGDLEGAIELSRAALDEYSTLGDVVSHGPFTAGLVEALVRRGTDEGLREAGAAIDRLAAIRTEAGFVLNEIWLLRLRALLARRRGDDAAYLDYRDRYRSMAKSLRFDGHSAMADELK